MAQQSNKQNFHHDIVICTTIIEITIDIIHIIKVGKKARIMSWCYEIRMKIRVWYYDFNYYHKLWDNRQNNVECCEIKVIIVFDCYEIVVKIIS